MVVEQDPTEMIGERGDEARLQVDATARRSGSALFHQARQPPSCAIGIWLLPVAVKRKGTAASPVSGADYRQCVGALQGSNLGHLRTIGHDRPNVVSFRPQR